MSEDSGAARTFRRRRRRNHPGGRDLKIEVKVTESEKQRLAAAAGSAGVSVQRLMVTRALAESAPDTAAPRKAAAWAEAMEVRNLLAALSVNMNQIARHANSTGAIPADFGPAVLATRRAAERVRDAFGEVFAVRFPGTRREDLPYGAGDTEPAPPADADTEAQVVADEWDV